MVNYQKSIIAEKQVKPPIISKELARNIKTGGYSGVFELNICSEKELFSISYALKQIFYQTQKLLSELTTLQQTLEQFVESEGILKKKTPSIPSLPLTTSITVEKKEAKDKEETKKAKENEENGGNKEKEESEVLLFQKLQMEAHQRYKEYVEKTRAERELSLAAARLSYMEKLKKAYATIEKERKEDLELEPFEIQQLQRTRGTLMRNQPVFDALFSSAPVKFSDLERLITALYLDLSGLPKDKVHFKLIEFNGSHFKAFLPNTKKEWTLTSTVGDTHFYALPRKSMSTLDSHCSHGKSHDDEVLSRLAKEKCFEAFKKAGITPIRLEKALEQLELRTTGKSVKPE